MSLRQIIIIELFQCLWKEYRSLENTFLNPPMFLPKSNCKFFIIPTYIGTYTACVNSVELGTIAATKASLFVVRKFFNMNSMHGTHTFCLQMSGLSVFFRKPLNHFLRNATHSPYYSHSRPTSWYVCKKHPVPLMSKSWQQFLVFWIFLCYSIVKNIVEKFIEVLKMRKLDFSKKVDKKQSYYIGLLPT